MQPCLTGKYQVLTLSRTVNNGLLTDGARYCVSLCILALSFSQCHFQSVGCIAIVYCAGGLEVSQRFVTRCSFFCRNVSIRLLCHTVSRALPRCGNINCHSNSCSNRQCEHSRMAEGGGRKLRVWEVHLGTREYGIWDSTFT